MAYRITAADLCLPCALTFRVVKSVFSIWIDLNQQSVLFHEQLVHIEQRLGNLVGYIAQTDFLGDFGGLFTGQTGYNVDWFVQNCVWILSRNFFDINTTLRRCNDYGALRVNRRNLINPIFLLRHMYD